MASNDVVNLYGDKVESLPEFDFEDFIGREWSNEYVEYYMGENLLGVIKDRRLVDEDGNEALYQRNVEAGTFSFLANVPEFGRVTYKFVDDGNVGEYNGLVHCAKRRFY